MTGGRRFALRAPQLVPWLDLAAVAFFALEGAVLAAQADFDIFGVLVVAVASALAGGTLRDLLIGDVPPASVRDQRYLWPAVSGGLIAFGFNAWVTDIPSWLLTGLDAGGLALFAVTGAAACFALRVLTAWRNWDLPTVG